jgi:hypothetical protein
VLFWSHSVQCKIDDVAASLGLYKIKTMGHQGPCCMFASTPEMPAKQQAGIMFTAAKRLSSMLAEVSARSIAGVKTCRNRPAAQVKSGY